MSTRNEILEEILAATGGGGGSDTPAEVKQKYESNANTNAFTDADRDKAALPLGLLEGEIGVSADLEITNSNFADYRGKIINCHAGTPFTVTLSNVAGVGILTKIYIGSPIAAQLS